MKNKKSKAMKQNIILIGIFMAIGLLVFISPTITLSQTSATGNLTNVTLELSNFTHLNVSNSSIVAYWSFDENYNSTYIFDYTNNSNDGTLKSGAFFNFTGSPYNTSVQFDGVNDYIEIPDHASLKPSASITFGAWINPYSVATDVSRIIDKENAGGTQGYTIAQGDTDGKVTVRVGGTLLANVGTISNNQWHLIMVRYNGTDVGVFIDGSSVGSTPKTGDIVYGTDNLFIGKIPTASNYFNGSIDEVMIWNIALNSTEILAIYNNQTSRFFPTGTMNFTGVNFAGNDTINITLAGCQQNMGSSLKASVNNGAFVAFDSSCKIQDYNATGNLNSANVTIQFLAGTNNFYTPLVIGNLSLDSANPTFPSISIAIPTNNSFISDTSQDVNFTVSETNPNTCWYSNDTYTTNTTLTNCNTNITTVIWSEGQHNVTIWANDTVNNVNSSRVIFTIDTTKPLLDFVSPTPANNSGVSNNFEINVSITELNLASVIYNWNGTNYTIFNESSVLHMNLNNNTAIGENGTRAVDVSGNANHGTFNGGPVWNSSGKYGSAVTFDGVNDYILLPTISIANDITVSAWVYSDNFERNMMVVEKANVNAQWALFFENAGTPGLKWAGGAADYGCITSSFPTNNQWHHIAATQSGTACSIYIDGVLNDTGTNTAIGNGNGQIYISSYDGAGYFFNGSIDEVRIYNRSLSGREITQLYNVSNLQKLNNTNWLFYANQTGLTAGNSYTYYVYAKDKAGNSNSTATRTILGNSAPTFISIDRSPATLEYLDPNSLINVTVNISDTDSNFDTAFLQWKNSTATWNNATNVTMLNSTAQGAYTILNASFTPTYEANYSYRIWANDTTGASAASSETNVSVFWDCTWTATSDLGSTAGWDENKRIGNIILNNTGDSPHSTGCSLDFRLTYDLPEGRIYFDNIYYKPSSTYTLTQ